MLKNLWYAIEFSDALRDSPLRLKVLGQDLVLYRDSHGNPVCMSDLCVHRGGALSDGWVEGDCIVCPYHGWNYEPSGACVRIPANAAGMPIPRKARVDSYPAVDRYGWIWAFLGDLPEAERPPLPDLSGMEDASLHRLTGEFKWRAHYTRVMENAVDFAHAPFVHGSVFGDPERPEVAEFEVEQNEWSAFATADVKASASKGLWRRMFGKQTEAPLISTTNGFWLPNITLLHVRLPLGDMFLYDANVPVDEHTTITKWVQLRSFFKGRWADRDARRRVERIFLQDQRTVEAQRPELLPYDLADELHVKADGSQVAYRRMRRKLLERGWGIDTHRIESEYTGRRAVVIPSPARREDPELERSWVMREVPVRRPDGAPSA